MKLKKVLSMALAGVLALSMLTACGGNNNEDADASEEPVVTVSTEVVEQVEANLDSKNSGASEDQIAALPLTGDEDSHVAFAKSTLGYMNTKSPMFTVAVLDTNKNMYGEKGTATTANSVKSGETYMAIVKQDTKTATVKTVAKTISNWIVEMNKINKVFESMTVAGLAINDSGYYVAYSVDDANYDPDTDKYVVVVFTVK